MHFLVYDGVLHQPGQWQQQPADLEHAHRLVQVPVVCCTSTYAIGNAHSCSKLDSHCHCHSYSDRCCDCNIDPYAQRDSYSESNRYRNRHCYRDSYGYSHVYPNVHSDGHGHGNSYIHTNRDSDLHADINAGGKRDANCYSYGDSHANSCATCGADGPRRHQCNRHELYRELEECKWCEWLPLGCLHQR
jgi:hypothetical protein